MHEPFFARFSKNFRCRKGPTVNHTTIYLRKTRRRVTASTRLIHIIFFYIEKVLTREISHFFLTVRGCKFLEIFCPRKWHFSLDLKCPLEHRVSTQGLFVAALFESVTPSIAVCTSRASFVIILILSLFSIEIFEVQIN